MTKNSPVDTVASDVPVAGVAQEPNFGDDNPFEDMMARFDHAAELVSLDPGIYKVLRHPEKQIIVSIPIQLDTGDVESPDTG